MHPPLHSAEQISDCCVQKMAGDAKTTLTFDTLADMSCEMKLVTKLIRPMRGSMKKWSRQSM